MVFLFHDRTGLFGQTETLWQLYCQHKGIGPAARKTVKQASETRNQLANAVVEGALN